MDAKQEKNNRLMQPCIKQFKIAIPEVPQQGTSQVFYRLLLQTQAGLIAFSCNR